VLRIVIPHVSDQRPCVLAPTVLPVLLFMMLAVMMILYPALTRAPSRLTIYFPATKQDFLQDTDHVGYLKSNTVYPVAFVQKEKWADFLASYLKY
jgi:hypothetical protein